MAFLSQRVDLGNRFRLEGASEIQRALEALSATGAKSAGRMALRRVARTLADAAKQNVPVRERRLRRAINVRVDKGKIRPDLLLAMVYVDAKKFGYRDRKTNRRSRIKGKLVRPPYTYQIGSRPDVYGAFLEFGAPQHGIAPLGWMRRAWDQQGGEKSIKEFGAVIGPAIIQAARSYGFRAFR